MTIPEWCPQISNKTQVCDHQCLNCIADIDRIAERRGLKLHKLTMIKGKIKSIIYRKKVLTQKDKAVIDSVQAYLDSLGPPEAHTADEIRQWQEFRGAWLQEEIKKHALAKGAAEILNGES
jgi:hypothetical protein